ncbi:hypothetical protein SAMD00020551_3155 [Mesobacillus selenatarsenatis SF-1]|uniref:Uncharacterized protein n=1 Tax=Mesobacillus selenatarsenatis (strain DSM 18680 / JCM 14380 / FERM P-15431 / SF-1) TaxID=1321606 RepID=A0A0A8X6W4_MESS1|nr:hypothetical protein SAMD00020551_3155 [Mesobacillus selenatarsenatis SF-1]
MLLAGSKNEFYTSKALSVQGNFKKSLEAYKRGVQGNIRISTINAKRVFIS